MSEAGKIENIYLKYEVSRMSYLSRILLKVVFILNSQQQFSSTCTHLFIFHINNIFQQRQQQCQNEWDCCTLLCSVNTCCTTHPVYPGLLVFISCHVVPHC